MTITVTSLGPNTTQINLANETSLTNFITALDNAIVGGGWTQYDVSSPLNRVYSCLNVDGVTSKLIQITIDPGTFRISTTSYETWNATTHIGTNQTYTFNRAGTAGIALHLCDVLIMVSSKWLLIQTFIRNQSGPWSGVIELAREAPEDTAAAGYPCWAWISSCTIFSTNTCVSLPRTVTGLTGAAAAAAQVGLQLPLVKILGINGLAATYLANTNLRNYVWNSSSRMIQDARPSVGYTELHGLLYGMKFTYNLGQPFNQVNLPIDQYYNYSSTGTVASHWVLGATPINNPVNTLGMGTYSNLAPKQITVTGNITGAVPVGNQWYINTTAGILVVDDSATAMAVTATLSTGSTSGYIVYDGYQYVYAGTTTTNIIRIDTLNGNAIATLAIGANTGTIFYDGTYIWVGSYGSVGINAAKVYQINLSTFTIANTISIPNAVAAFVGGICSDNVGNTYVATSELAVYKIVNSTSTVTRILNYGLVINSSYTQYAPSMFFNGDGLMIMCSLFGASNAYLHIQGITTSGGTLVTVNDVYISGTPFTILANVQFPQYFGKLGIFDAYFPALSSSATGIGVPSLPVAGTADNVFTTPLSTGFNYLYQYSGPSGCDGNRLWVCSATVFTIFNGVFSPDEQTAVYGRILLPS